MRLKDLFTVPTDEKVTEKGLNRVLASSICGLLLCMACLVGTTWAWFTNGVVDDGNVIQIGKPQVVLKVNGADVENGGSLWAGNHIVNVEHANQADSLEKKSNLFVTFTVSSGENVVSQYVMLGDENDYTALIKLQLDGTYAFSWNVTWGEPTVVDPVVNKEIVVTADQPSEDPAEGEKPSEDPAEGEQPGTDDPAEQPGETGGESGGETGGETGGESGGETGGESGGETGGETEQETT